MFYKLDMGLLAICTIISHFFLSFDPTFADLGVAGRLPGNVGVSFLGFAPNTLY